MENKSELFEPFLKELIGLLRKYNVDLMVVSDEISGDYLEAQFLMERGYMELNLLDGVYEDDTPERFLKNW